MRDWRTMLRPDLDGKEDREHGQNGQNGRLVGDSVNSVHIPDARQSPPPPAFSATSKVVSRSSDVVLEPASPTIRVGDRIEWERADLTVQQGIVDVVHRDTDGQAWAFCTVPGGSWTAVNVKFAKGSHR